MFFHALWVNLAICLSIIPPSSVVSIVQKSEATDLAALGVFSILWGLGTYGFGYAVQIAGMGLATTLIMGVIVVVGTFLPLLLDPHGSLFTPSGGVVVFGIIICCGSFYLAMGGWW